MKVTFKKKAQEQVSKWVDYKGAKLEISGVARPSFQYALELNGQLAEQYRQGIKKFDDEDAAKASVGYMAAAGEYLILNWSGIVDEDGKPIEYSPETAALLCTSAEESIDLFIFVMKQAQAIQKEFDQESDDILGKSESITNTETSTVTSPSTKKRKEKNSA